MTTTETNFKALREAKLAGLKQELNMYMACQVAIGDIRIPARECNQAKEILDFLEAKILPLQAQVTVLSPPLEEVRPTPMVDTPEKLQEAIDTGGKSVEAQPNA